MRDTSVEELRGFEVVEGDPDVRGWEVVGRDGVRIGEVQDLVADAENPAVRYLDVRLDEIPAGEGEILGQADVAGDRPPEMPARTIGESLVRDSLQDVEIRMIDEGQPGFDRGRRHTLIPAGQVHIDSLA